MTKIGDGRPGVGPQPTGNEPTATNVGPLDKATAEKSKAVLDSFVRAGVPARLEQMAGTKKAMLGPVQFTNQDLARVAEQFAVWLKKNTGADRKQRAREFARLVMKRKNWQKVFTPEDEPELEKMYDAMADLIDSSPRLAQLTDEVTDWSLRSPVR